MFRPSPKSKKDWSPARRRLVPIVWSVLCALPALAYAGEGHSLYIVPGLYTQQSQVESNTELAGPLVTRARQAAADGQMSLALQLATEALQHDPNEPTCRQVLGYEQIGDLWLTPFQERQIERGFVWDSRFGWIKPSHVAKYEAGQRRFRRRWVTVEADSRLRAKIENGWQVRTDHFLVTTNHNLESAAKLAAQLEQLFQVWRQLFAGYYLGEAEVRARFEGKRRARVQAKPFNVIYHRSKQHYIDALRHKQPRIGETLGIYFDDLREAHFYFDAEADAELQRATLYHEAVHQLFQESNRSKPNVGKRNNFWAVEGVATYFESLTPVDDPTSNRHFTIGLAGDGRLPAARRQTLASDSYLVPLDEMASLGRDDLQRRADLRPLYSQLAGVATFLMHAEREDAPGGYREPLVAYLRDLYAGRTDDESLFEACGKAPAELQQAYRQWLIDQQQERLPD